MPAVDYLSVGPSGPQADGTSIPARAGHTGDAIVSELLPRYAEQVVRGNTFIAANTGAQAISVALATAYTGLCISNPLQSGVNMLLVSASFGLSVAPAAIATINLIGGFSATANVTHTTPVVPLCALLGSSKISIGKADSSATIPTPQYLETLSGGFTAAALPSAGISTYDIGGRIVLAPGGFVGIGALTAVTGISTITWVEVPI